MGIAARGRFPSCLLEETGRGVRGRLVGRDCVFLANRATGKERDPPGCAMPGRRALKRSGCPSVGGQSMTMIGTIWGPEIGFAKAASVRKWRSPQGIKKGRFVR